MLYCATVNKSPCHFSRSRETLVKIGAVGISPAFYSLPIDIAIRHDSNGKPYMNVTLKE